MRSWLFLLLAIVLEVLGTTTLKLSDGMSRWTFVVATAVFYLASIVFLGLTLKRLEVSITYAIWAGLGTALISIIGFTYFSEPVSALKVGSIALIILGVVGLNLGA
jgi:small multidrug resistance pump